MGHQDKGHYSAKHHNVKIDNTIAEKIQGMVIDNCLTCASAHKVGKILALSPSEIGVQTDLLEYRISECQLGLFGYSDGKKRIDPDVKITPYLNTELDTRQKNNIISCIDCWTIAKDLKINRLSVGSACEKKKIRIKPCQLGAF